MAAVNEPSEIEVACGEVAFGGKVGSAKSRKQHVTANQEKGNEKLKAVRLTYVVPYDRPRYTMGAVHSARPCSLPLPTNEHLNNPG